jgi:hypothetical protein
MEDLWLLSTGQSDLQSVQAELRIKAVGKLPAVGEAFSEGVHMPGEENNHRH